MDISVLKQIPVSISNETIRPMGVLRFPSNQLSCTCVPLIIESMSCTDSEGVRHWRICAICIRIAKICGSIEERVEIKPECELFTTTVCFILCLIKFLMIVTSSGCSFRVLDYTMISSSRPCFSRFFSASFLSDS